ncbi:hypothetical protein O9992_26965 [Vibrio lentus]|nr:hypothetical protein [Vibrio lentus]
MAVRFTQKIEDLGVRAHRESNPLVIVAGENARYRMNFSQTAPILKPI